MVRLSHLLQTYYDPFRFLRIRVNETIKELVVEIYR